MKQKIGFSIFHGLFVVFLAIVIIISGVLTAIFYFFNTAAYRAETEDRIVREFAFVDYYFNEHFKGSLVNNLQGMADNPLLKDLMTSSERVRDINSKAVERLFSQAIERTPSYESISFTNYLGEETILVAKNEAVKEDRREGGNTLFNNLEAASPGTVAIEGPYMNTDDKVIFAIGMGTIDEDTGEFGGTVVLEYCLDNFIRHLGDITVLAEKPIWVLQADGRVLHKPEHIKDILDPRPYLADTKQFQTEAAVSMTDEGMVIYKDLSIVARQPLIRLVLSMPSGVMYKDARNGLRYSLFVFLACLLITTIVVYYISLFITRPILKLVQAAEALADGNLDTRVDVNAVGEVKILVGSFNRMANDLQKLTELQAHRKNELKRALNGISSHIQCATGNVDYAIDLENTNLERCYEVKKCGKEDCPCFGKEAMRCWQVAGTFCGGEVQGSFAKKYQSCSECNIFKTATADPISQIEEQFNNMMHVIAQKNMEIQKAYEELKASHSTIIQQEKMATIGQLAAGVAHEINNPTGFVSSNLQSLRKYVEKLTGFVQLQSEALEAAASPETLHVLQEEKKRLKIDYLLQDVRDLIDESAEGTERIQKIVQNLKTFSRIDGAEIKDANLNDCIETTLNIVWNELKYKTTVAKDYGEIPLVKCYPQQINQVIMNLLVNAGQAIEERGEIKIKTWAEDGAIKMSISDTGSGIPEAKLDRIFEPFYTTKAAGKGTGLGLSISYDIVKKHNGEMTVSSVVGKGTTFVVTIPVRQDSLARQ